MVQQPDQLLLQVAGLQQHATTCTPTARPARPTPCSHRRRLHDRSPGTATNSFGPGTAANPPHRPGHPTTGAGEHRRADDHRQRSAGPDVDRDPRLMVQQPTSYPTVAGLQQHRHDLHPDGATGATYTLLSTDVGSNDRSPGNATNSATWNSSTSCQQHSSAHPPLPRPSPPSHRRLGPAAEAPRDDHGSGVQGATKGDLRIGGA